MAGLRSDWSALPSVAIVEIYKYLPLIDTLSASSTCSHWRDTLCYSSHLLWHTLSLSYPCRHQVRGNRYNNNASCNIADYDLISGKFAVKSENLVLEWQPCETDRIIDLLTAIQHEVSGIKKLTFKQKSALLCKKRCRNACKLNIQHPRFRELLSVLISLKHVYSVDCGFSFEAETVLEILKKLKMKFKDSEQSMKELNIAYIFSGDEAVQVPVSKSKRGVKKSCKSHEANRVQAMQNELNHASTTGVLKNLEYLTVNGEMFTEAILKNLLKNSPKLEYLKILATDLNCCCFPSDDAWKEISLSYPNLRVHLIINEKTRQIVPLQIFRQHMPVTSLCFIYQTKIDCREFFDDIEENLRLWLSERKKFGFSSFSAHYIEKHRDESTSAGHWLNLLDMCAWSVKKIHFTGMFLKHTGLTYLVNLLPVLEDIIISKQELVTSATCSSYLHKITAKELTKIEETISKKLGRPWKAQRDPSIQGQVGCVGNRLIDLVHCVLQETCMEKDGPPPELDNRVYF